MIYEGADLELVSRASGVPRPIVTWYKADDRGNIIDEIGKGLFQTFKLLWIFILY